MTKAKVLISTVTSFASSPIPRPRFVGSQSSKSCTFPKPIILSKRVSQCSLHQNDSFLSLNRITTFFLDAALAVFFQIFGIVVIIFLGCLICLVLAVYEETAREESQWTQIFQDKLSIRLQPLVFSEISVCLYAVFPVFHVFHVFPVYVVCTNTLQIEFKIIVPIIKSLRKVSQWDRLEFRRARRSNRF